MNQSRNIELGTFNWDSTKLRDEVAANFLHLEKLKDSVKDNTGLLKFYNNVIKDLEKKIEKEREEQEKLNRELDRGHITLDEYTAALDQSNQAIDQFITEQDQAVRQQAQLAREITDTTREIGELNTEQRELNRLMAAGRTEINQNEGAYKELNNELNALKTEAKNLGAELALMERNGMKESEPERYRELAAAFAEASTNARELNDQFVEIDASVGDNQRNVGNYKSAITGAFSEITGGLAQMASGDIKGGFESVKEGFKGMKTAAAEAFAFIMANPLVALAAGLLAVGAGIYKGVQAMIEYNESIKESIKLTQDLTGFEGQAADQVRVRGQALADTFGGEYQEYLKTANTLAKQLGITYEEAFDKIEQGFVRGANANGDFLDRLSEYGPLLNKYGFNLDEIIGLQIQAQEQGLFGDKFEDSIKEAGLSLEEFTKAQSDAISNAFGKQFADKISHDVNSGAITVKDALILMSAEAKKQGISVQQFGVLTADVFKGAGEDIGGARVMFENIYEGVNNLKEPLTAVQQKTLDLSKANLELAKAKDDALKSDKLMEFMGNWDMFLVQAETIFYKFIDLLMDGISWFDRITGSSEVLSETWDVLKENVNTLWGFIETLAGVFNDLFDALGLSSSGTESYLKSVLKVMNPLSLLKAALQLVGAGVKGFTAIIENSRITLTTWAIAAKSIFAQIVDAAKSFMALDFAGGLQKLKNINLSEEYTKARKEAERIVALNRTKKEKAITEPAPEKDNNNASDKNKTTTQADRDAAAKAAAEAAKKAAADAKAAQNKKIADAKKAAEEAKKALEEEAKRVIDIAKTTAEQKADIAKTELADYIATNAEKLKDDKNLSKEKLKNELAYYDELKKKQVEANNKEKEAKVFAVQQKIDEINKKIDLGKQLNENDKAEILNHKGEIDNINKEFSTKEKELTNDTNEKKKELNKKYEEQIQEQRKLSQAISYQQRILDLEVQGNSEFEIRKLQEERRFQDELKSWAEENEIKMDLDNDKYLSDQEIQVQRDELKNQYDLAKDENERQRIQTQLDGLDFMVAQSAENQKKIDKATQQAKVDIFASAFGSIKSLFGESTAVGKAAAIAETTINTYKAAQAAYAAGASLGGPLGAVMGPILAGLAVASGLKNVQKIVSVKADKAADGMLIGPSHKQGGIPIKTPNGMIEAEGGEVIINKRSSALYRRELSAINLAGGGVKFADGGILGSSIAASNLSTVQNSITASLDINAMADIFRESIAEGAERGTYSGSQNGINDLSTNNNIAKGANH
ncbi:hypothetical protein CLU96_1242 [Chryseobacterium sp. 52]|uniref:phage tail tape measure protein n=1 Tax=Chryseobacterium sp. 52 TaxID=2035213 RepID=UPI000C198284|nr:phage tail tape measure protein [Chryseobacterium sp. 52]PIF44301.1 hypothetical protein CLU96_1242 [Chryseobacterium sp. 52]